MGITARITIDPMAGRRLTPRARDLRRNQTDAEERLWSELHGRRLAEAKFTRQVLLDQNFRPEGAIVAETNSQVVGFCLSLARQMPLENAPSDADRGYVTLFGVLQTIAQELALARNR